MKKWIYIAGRGHSGSTMLDVMLGNAKQIESVGELISGMGRYEGLCSCGEEFQNCSYWSNVRKKFEEAANVPWDEAVQSSVGQSHISQYPFTLFTRSNSLWVMKLKNHSEHIADAIGKTSSKEFIVDSSKEITRALFMMRFVSESKVIHLVRHPKNVLQSNYSRLEKGDGFKFLRKRFTPKKWFGPFLFTSALSWTIGNIMAEVVRLFGKERFLLVRYEDLVNSPEQQFNIIEEFIGVSLDEIKSKVREKQTFAVGHNIGGNQMRMAKSFILDPKKASRIGLPKRYNFMVHVLCFPLMWKYGYYRKDEHRY